MLRKVSIKVLDLDSYLLIGDFDDRFKSKLKHLRKIMADKKFMNRLKIYFKLGMHYTISDHHYTVDEVINIEEFDIPLKDYLIYLEVRKIIGGVCEDSSLVSRLISDIIDEYSFCQSMDVDGIEYDPKIDIYLEQSDKGYRY